MTDQLAFGIDLPSRPVTDETAAILRLMHGDPVHERDRQRIVEAIVYAARHSTGVVDLNKVRARLSLPSGELVIYPRLIGSVVHVLASRGVLVVDGWILNQDRHGGNFGKPQRRYRLVREVAA